MGNKHSSPPIIHVAPVHIAPIHIAQVQKPKINMRALQESVGIIVGVISLFPPAKLVISAIIAGTDGNTHGAASNYLNSGHSTNSTLNMLSY